MSSNRATTNLNSEISQMLRNERDLRPALIFLSGELMAAPIPLERETVTLGRAHEADIRLNDSQVSRLHAQITTVQDSSSGETHYLLKDLTSTNGTLVNGRQIE